MKHVWAVAMGGLCLGSAVALAAPGDPIGADDPSSCAQDTAAHEQCSDSVSKLFDKLIQSVIKCHLTQADCAWKNANGKPCTFDEEGCEKASTPPGKSAKEKFDAAIAKLSAPPSGPCIGSPVPTFAATEESVLLADKNTVLSIDAQNQNTYCDNTQPAIDPSGDDAGFIPATKDNLKCSDTSAKLQGKLVSMAIKCHVKKADTVFQSASPPFDEEACEDTDADPMHPKSALGKYKVAAGKLANKVPNICPPCLDEAHQDTIGTNIVAQLDGANGLVFPCPTTTTTTTSTSTTSTTCATPTGTVVKGSLTATPGRFNYNLMLGLPGANSACNTNFAGSHACSLTELQGAPASDLACLKDTASNVVTSFWAIAADASTNPSLSQCKDDAVGGSGLNWEYGTAHTASRGEKVALTNATGALGPLQTMLQCNLSGSSWVACCQ